MKAIPWAVVGFAIGAAIGFGWGQKTKSHIGDNVTTRTEGGKLILEVDAGAAARGGLNDLLQSYL